MHVDFFCSLDRHEVWRGIDLLLRSPRPRGGVYRIHALRAETPQEPWGDRFATVSRVAEEDALGRLYIGGSTVFTVCLFELWKAFTPPGRTVEPHRAGRAYRASPAIQRRYQRLGVSVHFTEDPAGAQEEELAAYTAEFGEAPPLHMALAQLSPPVETGIGNDGPLAAIA